MYDIFCIPRSTPEDPRDRSYFQKYIAYFSLLPKIRRSTIRHFDGHFVWGQPESKLKEKKFRQRIKYSIGRAEEYPYEE